MSDLYPNIQARIQFPQVGPEINRAHAVVVEKDLPGQIQIIGAKIVAFSHQQGSFYIKCPALVMCLLRLMRWIDRSRLATEVLSE